MDRIDAKMYFAAPRNMKLNANAAAQDAGLTNYGEYLRLALQFLIEHRTIPEEFKGKRAVVNVGRPLKSLEAQQ